MKSKIQNILLIRPPTTLPSGIENQGIGEPLGILYIAAVLKRHGYKVNIFDASSVDLIKKRGNYITYGSDHRGIKDQIRKISPDIIGVSCFVSASEFDLFETCRIAKEVNENIPVVVGGSHPTIFPKRMLKKKYIDYVIMHEGEYRLLFLIDSLNKNESEFRFDGIAYEKSNKININPANTWIEDLDNLPYPARELVDMEQYARINEKYNRTRPFKKGLVLVTRGCFNSCSYCFVYKFWGRKIRKRSVKNIIGEIELLRNKYGIKDIFFVDDNFNFSKKFIKELFSYLKNIDVRYSIPLGVYPGILDKEIIRLMAESGVRQIKISIESGSERVLKDIMHRDLDLNSVKGIVKECHRYNLKVHGSFILGMIGETREDIFKTINFPSVVGMDGAAFQIAVPFPGTHFYNEALKKGYLPKPFNYRKAVMSDISILKIPKSSPDFTISPEELRDLIIKKNNLSKIIMPS